MIKALREQDADHKPKDIRQWFMTTALPYRPPKESRERVMAGQFCPAQLTNALIKQFPKITDPFLNQTTERENIM